VPHVARRHAVRVCPPRRYGRIAPSLALAFLSLGFAPAPFPKADRQTPQEQVMRECVQRLEQLGVSWHVESRDGELYVSFTTHRPESRMGGGLAMVSDGNLLMTLQRVVRVVTRNASFDDRPPRGRR
jgi:hypothetical protein